MNMNGDLQAARKLLSELREAHQNLPRHFQLSVTNALRESACLAKTKSRTIRPHTPYAELVIGILCINGSSECADRLPRAGFLPSAFRNYLGQNHNRCIREIDSRILNGGRTRKLGAPPFAALFLREQGGKQSRSPLQCCCLCSWSSLGFTPPCRSDTPFVKLSRTALQSASQSHCSRLHNHLVDGEGEWHRAGCAIRHRYGHAGLIRTGLRARGATAAAGHSADHRCRQQQCDEQALTP
jgi:hypothetical protein